jgi:VIT1/CCC1 family predicted Fe2+/Mn2+ transporter
MMNVESHLQPVGNPDILRSAVVITIATLVGHLIPLVPFTVFERTTALITAFAVSGVVLFAVASYTAISLVGDWRRSGLQMLVIGLGAALLGYAINSLVEAVAR